jgi:hypothetical protein
MEKEGKKRRKMRGGSREKREGRGKEDEEMKTGTKRTKTWLIKSSNK